MDSGDIVRLIILFILIALSAYFSSSETALTTVNKMRMRSLADDGNKRAKTVLKITDDPGKMLGAILIGNNIVNLSASSLATTLTIHIWGNKAVGIATGILTFIILVLGEVTPKTLASLKAEKLSLAMAPVIQVLMTVFIPIIFIVNACSRFLLRLIRINPDDKGDTITEDELITVMDVSLNEGIIEDDEHEIFRNVIDFGDAVAKDVMIPRVHMISVDIDSSYDEVIDIYREWLYTRFPVFEGTDDHIVGVINVKDLLLLDDRTDFNVRSILRKAFFTYENKDTSELLLEMRKGSFSIAVVLDEYGEVSGVLTLEDLLEEIVGEIRDEYDKEEVSPVITVRPGEYIAEGSINLEEFNDITGLDLSSEECDSLGGYIMEKLDALPVLGDEITAPGNIRMKVIRMDDRRIDQVRVLIPVASE